VASERDADRHDPLEITLSAGAGIRGTVSRRDGRSAEGYWVRAATAGASGPGFGPFAPGADLRPTGADGTFSIDGLRAGETYDLVVLGPDGTGARREGVAAPSEDVDIVVPGPGRISGRVIDAQTLSPIADFQVDFGPDRSSGRGGFGPGGRFGGGGGRAAVRTIRALAGGGNAGPEAVHSEDGTYSLDEVPAGTWEVVAQAKGYQSASAACPWRKAAPAKASRSVSPPATPSAAVCSTAPGASRSWMRPSPCSARAAAVARWRS